MAVVLTVSLAKVLGWASELPGDGLYTLTLKNQLREPVRNVYCLVVFMVEMVILLMSACFCYQGLIPAGNRKEN